MKALQAICAVSAELAKDGISKERNNAQQGYKFRGIDDCLNALAPLMAKHGLVVMPECLERTVTERESRNGGMLFYVVVRVKYTFFSTEDGSAVPAYVFGEAMDSADKATNKAMSAAYKYAVIQTFCIPTEGDNDADATTHEPVKAVAQRFAQQKATIAKAFQEIRQDFKYIAGQTGTDLHKGGLTDVERDGESLSKAILGPLPAHIGSDAAPLSFPPEEIPETTWGEFLEYVGDDPERTKVGKAVKKRLAYSEMSKVPAKARRGIMLTIQDEAKRQGIPFEQWVTE